MRRRLLKSIDAAVQKAEPEAVESFSYGIPGFKLNGRPLVWCAAWKNHFSLYPMTAKIRKTFARELAGLETSTGTIQFPFSDKPPLGLIRKLVRARGDEIREAQKKIN